MDFEPSFLTNWLSRLSSANLTLICIRIQSNAHFVIITEIIISNSQRGGSILQPKVTMKNRLVCFIEKQTVLAL